MLKFFAVTFFFLTACFGQKNAILLNESGAQKLDESQISSLWSQVGNSHKVGVFSASTRMATPSAGPMIQQGEATIEVTSSGNSVSSVYRSITPILPGTIMAFRMTMPSGAVMNLDGYTAPLGESYRVYAELWNGPFPSMWPSGWTLFEAISMAPNGNISYVSSFVAVRACCLLTGPVQRVDVSQDGSYIDITGNFLGMTTVTLDGGSVPVAYKAGPNGYSGGRIITQDFSQSEHLLTVCSGGNCSTRLVYITKPSGKG